MTKSKSIILSLILLCMISILLFGCTARTRPEPTTQSCSLETKQCPDGSMVSRDPSNNCQYPSCPVKEEVTTQPQRQKTPNDAAVDSIIAKIPDVKSYKYMDSKSSLFTIVKGDKKVFITSDPNKWHYKTNTYNTIYIDDKQKLAFAACVSQPDTTNGFTCAKNVKTYTVIDYPTVEFENPFADFDVMEGAKITGSQTCESRQCDVIEYTKDGKKYRLFARKTYVLPYKIWEIGNDGKETLLVSYTNPAFDLKDSDLDLPKDLVLVP